ncbi:methyltransferase [Dactylosporangium vinaceum]|uniref:SCO2525 family SAM-dependent methyltransferase n=1 Tax=Dactylosporangium vinaceum TaxID=53362 RepID=A0ABV5MT01_9ACTN|nr:SCO2525 family SAM-dependent methyltransferase [Dactylosporangium vinaceum]UAB97691.1 methyltransferase [Dactylosporangium vinaceum]
MAELVLNHQVDWTRFDSKRYHDKNYRTLRADDALIIRIVRDFFSQAMDGRPPGRGIDVGTGTNLYPAFAMLPFCDSLDLIEYSPNNIKWLERQTRGFDVTWNQFWTLYRDSSAYAKMDADAARDALRLRARVKRGSVFDLSTSDESIARWDMGTMFFVACSISATDRQFRTALRGFVRSLRPGAPFAAGFMKHSKGYAVGRHSFPAAPVGPVEVHQTIADLVDRIVIYDVYSPDPLREDAAMMVATGTVRQDLA